MTVWRDLTDRERRVLAEISTCQGFGSAGVIAERLGLTVTAVAYDATMLRALGLIRRDQMPKLVTYDTTPRGDAALAEGQMQTVEVRGDVL